MKQQQERRPRGTPLGLRSDESFPLAVFSAAHWQTRGSLWARALLEEAEQGNWTAWLCSVAFRNRSQKFSKSSSSWSEVFSKMASTSVDTMLYTTKNDGCGGRGGRRERERDSKERLHNLKTPRTARNGEMVDQQPVLEGVDGFVGVEAGEARLTLGLRLSVNCREGQEVVLVTEPPNGPHI
ncbi:hypothetical protein EYF80_050571 [Liparis tanakae]|uniref:Uncharacterized protein n=1 Tax=Liparis tanakae TaxID=230148 RepID=A0A4Z2FDQ1_9TELE|nr:hypothetical protein EYF80_050571 [Liparis tanakae]